MSRFSRIFLASLLAVVLVALPVQALAAVRISKIQYDSPGSDTGSNTSLNAEYIVIRNNGSSRVKIGNWTIRDAANHVYRFAEGTRIAAGSTITVHTGSGSNTARHKYWRQGWYVWNNDGDTAQLRKGGGALADVCSYSGGGQYVSC